MVVAATVPLMLAWLACGASPWTNPAEGAEPIEPTELEPGVTFEQAVLSRDGVPMRVWLYTPTDVEGPLPLVVIGPAGSDMRTGMALTEADRPEHLPYVREGFAVVSFDIDGYPASPLEHGSAVDAYEAADNGVANARAALLWALRHEPRVDRDRVYAAGHSSAGTVALDFAAHEPQVRAVAAYAPVPDLPAHFETNGAPMGPAARRHAEAHSPVHLADQIDVPVFLFDSRADHGLDAAGMQRLWDALPENAASRRLRVDQGGHYDSMIDSGIPAAIEWMQGLAR